MNSSRAVMMRPRARGRMAPAGPSTGHVDNRTETYKQTGRPGAGSDLSRVLDVLPFLGLVWRRGHRRQRDSERLERKIQELLDFSSISACIFPNLHSSVPVSLCLVMGGAAVAGLKAGPTIVPKKIINKDVFVRLGFKHFDDAHFFGCNH